MAVFVQNKEGKNILKFPTKKDYDVTVGMIKMTNSSPYLNKNEKKKLEKEYTRPFRV